MHFQNELNIVEVLEISLIYQYLMVKLACKHFVEDVFIMFKKDL